MVEQIDRGANDAGDVKHDRRRPGRVQYTNRSLVRMLRRPFDHDGAMPPSEATDEPPEGTLVQSSRDAIDYRSDLASAQGVVYAAIGGAVLWVIIGAVLWLV